MAITHKAMLARVLADQDEEHSALQYLIDRGAWGLEGSTGRAMMAAIKAGTCVLGPSHAYDYWGNRIPSRGEVKPDTTGGVVYAYRSLMMEDFA